MPRYLTSAIFTDVAVTMSTFIASRREPWYEAYSSIMIDSAHRANQVRRWSRRTSYRDRHELILCVRCGSSHRFRSWNRHVRYALAGVINTTRPGDDRMASRSALCSRRAVLCGSWRATADGRNVESARSKLVGGRYRPHDHTRPDSRGP